MLLNLHELAQRVLLLSCEHHAECGSVSANFSQFHREDCEVGGLFCRLKDIMFGPSLLFRLPSLTAAQWKELHDEKQHQLKPVAFKNSSCPLPGALNHKAFPSMPCPFPPLVTVSCWNGPTTTSRLRGCLLRTIDPAGC